MVYIQVIIPWSLLEALLGVSDFSTHFDKLVYKFPVFGFLSVARRFNDF